MEQLQNVSQVGSFSHQYTHRLQQSNFQILSHTFIKLMLHSVLNSSVKSIHILSLWKRGLKWYNIFI